MSIDHLSAQNDLSTAKKTDFLLRQVFANEKFAISVVNSAISERRKPPKVPKPRFRDFGISGFRKQKTKISSVATNTHEYGS
jgi:hypothetical protein